MSKKKDASFHDSLHARGLRRSVAKTVAAVDSGRRRREPPKAAQEVIKNLRSMAREIEDRVTGGPAKRSAAARKSAATRQRNAAKRSASAKKAARTRKRTSG